ncbi:recombinase family protein [Streptosporangium canum]|uniref:recombinase family protein n=1 Tax=Streptosporangium canum TaxID=324952 RepID=UPI003685781D
MIESPRVLGVIRLSVTKDDSTSPERQRDAVEHWANGPAINGRVVGWAEDLDVSGGLHPMKRPALGPWLTERAGEFDVIAVWKLDRLSRRSMHFSEMIEWCRQNGKIIVSVTEGIDMSTPMGKMFAQIIAAFAEGELDTIRARVLASTQTRKDKGVWIGGVLPFGYQFARQAGGGKKLVQDPGGAKLLREIVANVQNDWSAYRIAVDLNQRHIPTWRDYLRIQNGEKPRGIQWNSTTVMAIVTNPTVAGYYTYKSELVEDDEGNPRMITDDPIITPSEWAQMVTRFTSERKGVRATPSRSMLGGVATCGLCGANMSSAKKTKKMADDSIRHYVYYFCNNVQTGTCPQSSRIPRGLLDLVVNDAVNDAIGKSLVFDKASKDSSPLRAELESVKVRFGRLESDYMVGRYDGEGQEESYWRMHKNLSAKISKLRAEVEELDSGPKFVNTGRTYGEVWAEKDDDQKRLFLKKHNARIVVFRNAVDWSDESVIVEFGDLKEIAQVNGLELEGLGYYRIDYQVPVMPNGEPASIEELRDMARAFTAMAKAPANEEERKIAEHRKKLINERARIRRFGS